MGRLGHAAVRLASAAPGRAYSREFFARSPSGREAAAHDRSTGPRPPVTRLLLLATCVAWGAWGAWGATEASAQDATEYLRSERVVLHSPHFDQPLEQGAMGCPPPAPAAFFGARSSTTSDSSGLAITVERQRYSEVIIRRPSPADSSKIAMGALFTFASLPGRADTTHVIADDEGRATVLLQPGVYEVEPALIGFGSGRGIVRVRESHMDSLLVRMSVRAVCDSPRELQPG